MMFYLYFQSFNMVLSAKITCKMVITIKKGKVWFSETETKFKFKGASPILFNFYKLLEILVPQESSSFLTTHGKFHSWRVFHLEGITENVPAL